MKSFLVKTVLILATLSMSAHAALIETDWKSSGDKQATLDTDTGIEWLDLAYTAKIPLDSLMYRMQGGDLTGWRFATEAEVGALIIHYNPAFYGTSISYYTAASGVTNAKLDPWRSLLGQTHDTERASMGVYQRDNGKWGMIGAYRAGLPRFYTMGYESTETLMISNVNSWAGYFLVSDGGVTLSSQNDPTLNLNNPNAPINNVAPPAEAVSTPFLPLALALLGLPALRRRKQN